MFADVKFAEIFTFIWLIALLSTTPIITEAFKYLISFLFGKNYRKKYKEIKSIEAKVPVYRIRSALVAIQWVCYIAACVISLLRFRETSRFFLLEVGITLIFSYIMEIIFILSLAASIFTYVYEFYFINKSKKLLSFAYIVMLLHGFGLPLTAYFSLVILSTIKPQVATHTVAPIPLENKPVLNPSACTTLLEDWGIRRQKQLDQEFNNKDDIIIYNNLKFEYLERKYFEGYTFGLAENFECKINDVELTHKSWLFDLISLIYCWLVSAFSVSIALAPIQKIISTFKAR